MVTQPAAITVAETIKNVRVAIRVMLEFCQGAGAGAAMLRRAASMRLRISSVFGSEPLRGAGVAGLVVEAGVYG